MAPDYTAVRSLSFESFMRTSHADSWRRLSTGGALPRQDPALAPADSGGAAMKIDVHVGSCGAVADVAQSDATDRRPSQRSAHAVPPSPQSKAPPGSRRSLLLCELDGLLASRPDLRSRLATPSYVLKVPCHTVTHCIKWHHCCMRCQGMAFDYAAAAQNFPRRVIRS